MGRSRRIRRASAVGNLAVMLSLAAGLATSGLVPDSLLSSGSAQAALIDAGLASTSTLPWLFLLLAMSSATASLLLLLAERERSAGGSAQTTAPPSQGTAVALPPAGPWPASHVSRETVVTMDWIGHDIRTPLTAIIGFSDMMRCELHGPLGSERYQSYAGHIRDSGVTLLQAIETAIAASEQAGKTAVPQHASGA